MRKPGKVFVDQLKMPEVPRELFEYATQYEDMIMCYHCAIREVRTKLEVLNDEFQVRRAHNPIQVIKDRIKSPESIMRKLTDKGCPISIDSIRNNIDDVAGLRVICKYIDDIYEIVSMIQMQDDIEVIKIKDYIKQPKESGYRSLHMIVETPIYLSEQKQIMRVEIQIRTMAMDFWASLEHQLRYKVDREIPDNIRYDLKETAEIVTLMDEKMQSIYKQMQQIGNEG
ncbi:MAG: GTP pyrophosphokinase family protein [Lachnospiraceae bacterium]